MIPDFKTFIRESIWSDMQDRSMGKAIRREDDINLMSGEDFCDYLNYNYISKSKYKILYSEHSKCIHIPILNKFIGVLLNLSYDYEDNTITMNYDEVESLCPELCKKIKENFKVDKEYVNIGYTKFIISPSDGSECTNRFFVDVINFIIDNGDEHVSLIKKKHINESIWSDMQDRSMGKTVRREDEIGNIRELKSVDMGGTVFWADKDLCCSDEYHFEYSEVFEYIKKSEWRLPTLKEVEELDGYKVKTYDNTFVISGPNEDLIFIARGLVYSDKVKEITDDDFYYAWTSDLCNSHQVHILTFDNDKLMHSKIDSINIMDQITNDISGKLCVRLVKDK